MRSTNTDVAALSARLDEAHTRLVMALDDALVAAEAAALAADRGLFHGAGHRYQAVVDRLNETIAHADLSAFRAIGSSGELRGVIGGRQ